MTTALGVHGQAIWDAYGAARLDAGSQALIREYARCADTLDRLNDLAAGRQETWASLVFDDMGEVHLAVDKILDQVRQYQVTLKSLHAEVRAAGLKAEAKVPGGEGGNKKDERPKDMLAALRQRKEQRERRHG
jgi:hypothetical protein